MMNAPANRSKLAAPRPWLRRLVRWCAGFTVLLGLMLLGPLSLLAFGDDNQRGPWWSATNETSGIAPSPQTERAAVVQVYAARTLRWRGNFAVHTWIASKRADADTFTIHHVIGWRYYRGGSPVVTQRGRPEFYWFGAKPDLLLDKRGVQAEGLIDQIEQAVVDYPYPDRYAAWPGPNSNTFIAFIARQVPELGLDLPPTAIGKDFLGDTTVLGRAPSGTGYQLSLYGVLGLTAAKAEGLEFNLLGLSAGIDFDDAALRLPGLGKVSLTGWLH